MTVAEKLAMVKAILRIDASDTSEDALIDTYLSMAGRVIIGWRYSNANPDNVPQDVPGEYEMTQVQAVINGYTQSGVEGQVLSIENGIHRHFEHSDMVSYIRAHVIHVAGVLRGTTAAAGTSSVSGEAAATFPIGEGNGNSLSQAMPDSSLGEGANGDGENG